MSNDWEAVSELSRTVEPSSTPLLSPEALQAFEAETGSEAFSSEAALHAAMDRFWIRKNEEAGADFCGLTPEQLHSLRRPGAEKFEKSVKLLFEEGRPDYMETPMVVLAFALLLHVDRAGRVKATPKWELPLGVVREIQETVLEPLFGGIDGPAARETDTPDLFRMRHAMQLAGLIECRNNAFGLTEKGANCLVSAEREDDGSHLYRHLMPVFMGELNWLLDGLDLRFWRPHRPAHYQIA